MCSLHRAFNQRATALPPPSPARRRTGSLLCCMDKPDELQARHGLQERRELRLNVGPPDTSDPLRSPTVQAAGRPLDGAGGTWPGGRCTCTTWGCPPRKSPGRGDIPAWDGLASCDICFGVHSKTPELPEMGSQPPQAASGGNQAAGLAAAGRFLDPAQPSLASNEPASITAFPREEASAGPPSSLWHRS